MVDFLNKMKQKNVQLSAIEKTILKLKERAKDNKYENLKIDFDMTKYDIWTKETMKLFKIKIEKILGYDSDQYNFLVNLAYLDKFVQDMKTNYNQM